MVEDRDIEVAARILRRGGLVAFPTETVYGLGANALDDDAVRGIFEAKGRPATSPLIVHVYSLAAARELTTEWPEAAGILAGRFWPGPLTLVLPKANKVPSRVTAGLDSVGLRIPAHPVALRLLKEAAIPIAAPSANRFTELSPTTAEHVSKSLGERVDYILDGGPTDVGIESTVVSLRDGEVVLLRPGMISQSDLEAAVGPVRVETETAGAHLSPGMHRQHYQPKTRLLLIEPGGVLPPGNGAYLWRSAPSVAGRSVPMPQEPDLYAAQLYQTLHELDHEALDFIAVEAVPKGYAWAGIADRLRRASSR